MKNPMLILLAVGASAATGAKAQSATSCADLATQKFEAAQAYCRSLAEANGGAEKVAEWSRIFLVPGMAYGGGGPALDQFDMLTAVVNWVGKNVAPIGSLQPVQCSPALATRSAPI